MRNFIFFLKREKKEKNDGFFSHDYISMNFDKLKIKTRKNNL